MQNEGDIATSNKEKTMDQKIFEVEIRIKGRFAVTTENVEEICKMNFSDDEGLNDEFLASAYGIKFQSAILDALMSQPQLLHSLLVSHATAVSSSLLGGPDDDLGLYQRIAKAMQEPYGKLFQELLDSDSEIELMLPILWSDLGHPGSPFGCIAIHEPFAITMASVAECREGNNEG